MASRHGLHFLLLLLLLLDELPASFGQECERLKASLTYTQEQAPRDLSGVLPVVVEKINRVLEGVVDVEVEWNGADMHGRVGEHIVQCKVTRLASVVDDSNNVFVDDEGREVATQCFHVPFSISDTNECTLPTGHPMRHECHDSAICINTVGSYECVCSRLDISLNPSGTADQSLLESLSLEDRTAWEVSFNASSRSSCPSAPSTHGCCPTRVHTKFGAACRAEFQCPVDPCSTHNNCSATAKCERSNSPGDAPNYTCKCPPGLMGNGMLCRPTDPKPEPKVMFDEKTPTEETIKNNYYCGCTKPVVDACAGFPACTGKHQVCTVLAGNIPKCACKPGYVMHEQYGCVDESPPILRLKHDPSGDQILRLKQGDVYKEYAVDIQDENAEEYLRSLKIAYSQPLPFGCLTKVGEFHVNYTVATPWTSPPYVRVTRRVIIEDIDECSMDASALQKSCPVLVPKCDANGGAKCVNTVGSYTCVCPKFTTGDGFLPNLSFAPETAPEGFTGGTGCVDTSKPVITLEGPNPKIFRVGECGGLSGVMDQRERHYDSLKSQQQRLYADELKELIVSTAGAELCATHSNSNPAGRDCIKAYDETYKGTIDLSGQVKVGDPVQKGPLSWSVPYDVSDEAGNAANTVWRDVAIEEVDLALFEKKVRQEMAKERKAEIDAAVQKAVEEDRRKRTSKSRSAQRCPQCPKCDCSGEFDESLCEQVCQRRLESCAVDEHGWAARALFRLESYIPKAVAEPLLLFLCGTFAFMFVGYMYVSVFYPRPRDPYAMTAYAAGPYVSNFPPLENGVAGSMPIVPPQQRNFGGMNGRDSFFSPQQQTTTAPTFGSPVSATNGFGASPQQQQNEDDIYADSPIITPSKRGDGVRRRSPFGTEQRYY